MGGVPPSDSNVDRIGGPALTQHCNGRADLRAHRALQIAKQVAITTTRNALQFEPRAEGFRATTAVPPSDKETAIAEISRDNEVAPQRKDPLEQFKALTS